MGYLFPRPKPGNYTISADDKVKFVTSDPNQRRKRTVPPDLMGAFLRSGDPLCHSLRLLDLRAISFSRSVGSRHLRRVETWAVVYRARRVGARPGRMYVVVGVEAIGREGILGAIRIHLGSPAYIDRLQWEE
jgi:hypothetical protein